MSLISADEFLSLLRRSKIVADEPLDKAVHFLQAQRRDQFPTEGAPLADELVELGLITKWQAEKLLARRYRGFFLGRYKLLDQIGTGGMSRVFLAEHLLLRRQRALKVLPRERVQDSTYLARFQLEARAIATLDHPNIVRAYDIDSAGDIHYLVMEYVAGPDLQQLVMRQGPLAYDVAARYLAQAARGLHHAHESGLIHRDVKPANLLVDEQEVVKVLDLGLALFHEAADEASLTIAHQENVLGTADYLAPEQALDSHSIDRRADLYGLGCTLYFALTGAPPFPEGSIAQRIARHQSRMPPLLHTLRPDCPELLEAICFRLLQKNPDDRYATAAEVADVLEAFADQYAGVRHELAGEKSQVIGERQAFAESRSANQHEVRLPNNSPRRKPSGPPRPDTLHHNGPRRKPSGPPRPDTLHHNSPEPSDSRPAAWDSGKAASSGSSSSRKPDWRTSKPRPNDTVSDQSAETLKGIPVVPPAAVSPNPLGITPKRRQSLRIRPLEFRFRIPFFSRHPSRTSGTPKPGKRWIRRVRTALLLTTALLAAGLLAFASWAGWWTL